MGTSDPVGELLGEGKKIEYDLDFSEEAPSLMHVKSKGGRYLGLRFRSNECEGRDNLPGGSALLTFGIHTKANYWGNLTWLEAYGKEQVGGGGLSKWI